MKLAMLLLCVVGLRADILYESATVFYNTQTALFNDVSPTPPADGWDVSWWDIAQGKRFAVVVGNSINANTAQAKALAAQVKTVLYPTVVGWKGQLQLQWAKPIWMNGLDIQVPCDVDGDGAVNVVDVQKTINAALAGYTDVTVLQTIINATIQGGCGL